MGATLVLLRKHRVLNTVVRTLINDTDIKENDVLGVGIAVPAIVSLDGKKMTYGQVLSLDFGKLEPFKQAIAFPCRLFNDANSAGAAEVWSRGSIEKYLVYLSVNNSVGGSILFKDHTLYGSNNRAGEFGHMTIVPGGRTCYCGQKGCLDSYCNAKILGDSANGSLHGFFVNLENKDDKATKIWEEYLYYLSLGVNNLRAIFDCDIVIGGYLGEYIDNYVEEYFKSLC